jgi:hypothetical protein
MTDERVRARSKFSNLALIVDHYDTLRDARNGRIRIWDWMIYFGLPLGLFALVLVLGGRAGHVPELLAAVAILTGLIFNVFVLLFDLTARAADKTDAAHLPTINKLADELRANISYAVLLGLALTAALGGLAMFTDTSQPLNPVATATITGVAVQMLLTISMILKRIRALYRAFRVTGPERIP